MVHAIWAQRLVCGSLWVLKHPYCHQMITQAHPKGGRRVLQKAEFFKISK